MKIKNVSLAFVHFSLSKIYLKPNQTCVVCDVNRNDCNKRYYNDYSTSIGKLYNINAIKMLLKS